MLPEINVTQFNRQNQKDCPNKAVKMADPLTFGEGCAVDFDEPEKFKFRLERSMGTRQRNRPFWPEKASRGSK